MARPSKSASDAGRKRPPATTPEARENQMISLAEGLAERQLTEGTASAQVITHYLKLATGRERLERAKLEHETVLLKAKTDNMESAKRVEELYSDALVAMSRYKGEEEEYDGY